MKRINLLAASLFLALMVFSGCGEKKDAVPEQTDTTAINQNDTAADQDMNTADNWWKTAGETKTITGRVVSLNKVTAGGAGTIKKDEAQKMVQNNQMIVLAEGTGKTANLYFVYNDDGTYAGTKLAEFAENSSINVTGRTVTRNNVKMIIVDKIEAPAK